MRKTSLLSRGSLNQRFGGCTWRVRTEAMIFCVALFGGSFFHYVSSQFGSRNIPLLTFFKLSREMIEVARLAPILSGRTRWCHPGLIHEVKELRHIHLHGISRGKTGKIKAGFNELQYCCVIRNRVRDVVL